MKRNRMALASAMALGAMADVALGSQRQSFAFGGELSNELTATNVAYTQTPADGIASSGPSQRVVGMIVYPATAIVATDSTVIATGFKPRYVCFENVTDRVKIEWYEGMAADSCIKTAANGTRTLEITGGNGGITVNQNSFQVLQNATLAAVLASKTCNFVAHS